MTSLQRVLTTLSHHEPDRVPWFLLTTLHGAKELGLSIRDYYAKPENVAEGQLRLRAKYHHDCLYSFFHAPLEVEAWGGEVIFSEDGPPNSGCPPVASADAIKDLKPPRVQDCPGLQKVLRAIELLKAQAKDEVPIIATAMSPFSLPVMQLGFDLYLDVLYERPDLFEHLMQINEDFCVEWSNAQLAAGATALCFFDPVSSPSIIPKELYLKTGFEIGRRTVARFKGPAAIHLASGRCLPIIDNIAQTGVAAVGGVYDAKVTFKARQRAGKGGNWNY